MLCCPFERWGVYEVGRGGRRWVGGGRVLIDTHLISRVGEWRQVTRKWCGIGCLKFKVNKDGIVDEQILIKETRIEVIYLK